MAERQSASPRWATVTCYGLIVMSWCLYGFSLDRYPLPFVDEPFYNYPAIRFLEGEGLTYKVSDAAPHGDTLWSYHAPFFPRLQVATYSLLGISEYAHRLPQYLAAHLAIFVLCRFLLRRGLFWSALILAVAWLGDRSSQEVLYGRMEGIYLLCLAGGFVFLARTTQQASLRDSAAAGLCLGTATGFHPVTLGFCAFGVGWLAWLSTRRRASAAAFVAGCLVPLGLMLACWLPSLSASLEQFLWNASVVRSGTLGEKFLSLFEVLRWSRYWAAGLGLLTLFWLMPLAVRRCWSRAAFHQLPAAEPVWILAAWFAVVGLLSLLVFAGAAVYPYYLVLFTVWPILALAVLGESRCLQSALQFAFWPVAVLVLLCWLPSLAWNALRFRESWAHFDQLDRTACARHLARVVPPGAELTGSPDLFLIARKAGLNFKPLPWYGRHTRVAPDAWILLKETDLIDPIRVAPTELKGRPMLRTVAFPNAKGLEYPLLLFRPRAREMPAAYASREP